MNNIQLYAISSPSGGGKTTIVKEVLRRHPILKFSISATTRSIRNGEINGKDYFFKTKDEFKKLITDNQLIEYEELFGSYYGTLKSEIENTIRDNNKMIFDVDVNGALNIKKMYPNNSKLIFIEPANIATLQQRLRERKTESEQGLEKRFQRIPFELQAGKKFDKIIINNKLEEAIKEVEKEIE